MYATLGNEELDWQLKGDYRMISYEKDIAAIKEKISQYRYASEQVRNWLVNDAHAEMLRRLCEGIGTRNSRDQFLEIIRSQLATSPGGEDQDRPDADEIYRSLQLALNDFNLTDGSVIKLARGRRGGMYLFDLKEREIAPAELNQDAVKAYEDAQEKSDKSERELEKNYYQHVKNWARENGYPNCEITGGKLPGYKWENPDLIEVQYSVGEFTRTLDFEITCFEVKLRVEPYAIWQAAHYKKFSHEVYVVFAKEESEIRNQDAGGVFALAVELGIGVLALDNGKKTSFKLIHSPAQLSPDTREINLVVSRFRELFKSTLETAENDLKKLLGALFFTVESKPR